MRPQLPISKESSSKEAARKCPDCPFYGCKSRVSRCRRSRRARFPWSCRDRERRSPLSLAKIQNGHKIAPFACVVDFLNAKASSFNTIQQSSTSEPQAFQQESLRINRILLGSTALAPGSGPGVLRDSSEARFLDRTIYLVLLNRTTAVELGPR